MGVGDWKIEVGDRNEGVSVGAAGVPVGASVGGGVAETTVTARVGNGVRGVSVVGVTAVGRTPPGATVGIEVTAKVGVGGGLVTVSEFLQEPSASRRSSVKPADRMLALWRFTAGRSRPPGRNRIRADQYGEQ